nr:MAG TPA: hypothetical protein [Caudoviricetes sp.]
MIADGILNRYRLFLCLQGGGYANGIQNPGHHR